MAKKRIKITTKGPISITARKPYGQFYETLNYIPARTLRGAYAQLLLDECMSSDRVKCDECSHEFTDKCDFYNLIYKGEVIKFGDCYPVHKRYEGVTHKAIPQLLPATAVSCKYNSGFYTGHQYYLDLKLIDIDDEPPHGVFDLLIEHIIYDGQKKAKYAKPKCPFPDCNEILEPFEGHYQMFNGNGESIYFRSEATMRRFGRSAINRKTLSAQEDMLYSVQTIAENNVFLGEIQLDDSDIDLMARAMNHLKALMKIGGQSSRGLGDVGIDIEDYEPDILSVKERIKKFNELIKIKGDSGEKIYFTVDLQSDAVLRSMLDEPTIRFDGALLRSHLGIIDGNFNPESFDDYKVKLESSYTSGSLVGGWSIAWELPKYVQLATSRGSVFLFSATKIDDAFCNSLRILENEGIGEKREEGFGKINVCEQFHLEVEPK